MKSSTGQRLLPGISPLVAHTNQQILQAAANERPVFVTGEVGTEKAFAAKLIHQLGPRADKPITKVSVSWKLPPDLSQYFEKCNSGSLIIHLQKEFPIDMQYTLVEMASDGCFADPMSGEVIEADVRIILMTSLDLETLSSRTPLLPELKELLISQHIEVPPLRDRLEDIPALVRYALKRAHDTGRTVATAVDPQVLTLFRHWDWPGNAEDLLLVTAQAAITARAEIVTLDDLPAAFLEQVDEETVRLARSVRSPAHMIARPLAPEPTQNTEEETVTSLNMSQIPGALLGDEPLSTDELRRAAETQRLTPREAGQIDPSRLADTQRLTREQAAGRPDPYSQQFAGVAADPPTHPSLADPPTDYGLADPPTDHGLTPATEPFYRRHEEVHEDDEELSGDPRLPRVLALARRLHAQSLLLKKQMSGPLDQSESPVPMEQLGELPTSGDAVAALEDELDRGLEMVHALRRQMAILNVRQQQSAEAVRDVVQRLSLISENPTEDVDRDELHREASELTESLGKIDEIIQRVSKEIPTFGRHVEGFFGSNDPELTQ